MEGRLLELTKTVVKIAKPNDTIDQKISDNDIIRAVASSLTQQELEMIQSDPFAFVAYIDSVQKFTINYEKIKDKTETPSIAFKSMYHKNLANIVYQ